MRSSTRLVTRVRPEANYDRIDLGTCDLAHLPPDDPAVYRMLQKADTIGVFQVESRAQMATLPRLQPEHFYDLVVEVAIIRPGPIVGQDGASVPDAAARRRSPSTYPHPLLEPVLKRTLGVPLFQEQLLRMAMIVAGFTGGEAEELRRAMGFKRSREAHAARSRRSCARGWRATASRARPPTTIVQSITSFALYGFPESHAASFALHRLRERVSEGALPGGVLHGAAQQPADGVLSSGDAGEGRAAARRAFRCRSTCKRRTGCGRSSRTADPARAAVRARVAGGGGARRSSRRGRSPARSGRWTTSCRARACGRRNSGRSRRSARSHRSAAIDGPRSGRRTGPAATRGHSCGTRP